MKREALLLFCLLSILIFPQAAQGQEGKNNGSLSLYWENDYLAKTDSNYTNGVKLTWTSPWISWKPEGESVPPGPTPWYHSLIKALPFVYSPGHQAAMFFLAGGQNIYTPDDTERQDLIVDDRPYAGYLYLGIGFLMKGAGYMDTLEVDVGIVGRHSYAQDIQEEVHKWIGEDSPKGWANQLKDEPALEINYERKWKWLKVETGDHWGFDVMPHLGGSVGNVAIYANAGTEIRFGWNRPDDYGSCAIRQGCESGTFPDQNPYGSTDRRFGVFLFAGVDGRAVLHDIFLDGNTFRDSHSVEKKPFVADLSVGLGIATSRLKVTYSAVYRTRQFDSQPSNEQVFGSLLITWYY
ncbi:MAG: lipid A deacylase LpxR family protein [Syntrophaceae bacterium]